VICCCQMCGEFVYGPAVAGPVADLDSGAKVEYLIVAEAVRAHVKLRHPDALLPYEAFIHLLVAFLASLFVESGTDDFNEQRDAMRAHLVQQLSTTRIGVAAAPPAGKLEREGLGPVLVVKA